MQKKSLLAATLVAASMGASSAVAQQRVVYSGVGVACDTQQQMERYIALYRGSYHEAVTRVNTENYEGACISADLDFVQGKTLSTVVGNDGGVIDIVEIEVLAVLTYGGRKKIDPPRRWFTGLPAQGQQEI